MAPSTAPKPSAPIALTLAGVGASAWLAAIPAPRRLHSAESPAIPVAESALDGLWLTGARLLPALEIGVRFEGWALLWCAAISVTAAWFAHQMFRGPGRPIAAVAAGLVCAIGLGAWIEGAPPRNVFPELPFTVLALLALAAVIRPLVRFGRLTPVAIVRALAAAAGAAVLLPAPGLPLLALVGVTCIVRARARRDLPHPLRHKRDPSQEGIPGDEATKSMTSRGVLRGRPWVLALIGLSPLLLAGPFAWWDTDFVVITSWAADLHLAAPPVSKLTEFLPPPVAYPAFALLVMLIAPLRWRGGVTMVTFVGLSLITAHGPAPLTPWPTLIALLAVAAAGWIWLAGTLIEHKWASIAAATAGAAVLLGLLVWNTPTRTLRQPSEPLADLRPELRLDRFIERGLIAPGDVVLLHDADARAAFDLARYHEGLRPDILVLDPHDYDPADLRVETFAWVADGRRVLSDSFNMGGRWQAYWAMESGPVYWYVFDVERVADQDFVLLPRARPPMDPLVARYIARSRLERARYRRALENPSMALHALSPWARTSDDWSTAVRTAEALRLAADVQSELPMPDALPTAEELDLEAAPLVDAEVGDLLFQAGDRDAGTRLLLRAGEEGYLPAYATLVRWELRAGELAVARQHLRQIGEDPTLRRELLHLVSWIAHNQPPMLARDFRDRLPLGEAEDAIEEVSTRLAVLRGLGSPPEPDGPTPDADLPEDE